MLIDSHAHLNDERLLGQVGEIISAMEEYGVGGAVCASYDAPSSIKAAELADKYAQVYATVATHPHEAKSFTSKDAELYGALAKNKKVLAIGETGLDYYYDLSPRDIQKKAFREHIALADELNLPLVVHVRDAYEDTLEILTAERSRLNNGVLIHNFSGDTEIMRLFDGLGCYYSFGGTLTFKNNKRGIEAFLSADISKILLETDCPYLTPEPHRGQLNYPYYVKYVAKKGAELKKIEYAEFADITAINTKRFFRIHNL
ncbi:MAG: TatD family hydrolase [Clostridiales bacterium]|jgi:TatD DNase family protein|nr:TatD family hydrolase [Clostridiales bacterium]